MEDQKTVYPFLYENYTWPKPGTKRQCPYSGVSLQLNEQRTGFNGKPWTCPKCIHFFSEEELENPDTFKGKDCSYTLEQKKAQAQESG